MINIKQTLMSLCFMRLWPVIAAILLNGVIFSLGWNGGNTSAVQLGVPGWGVGLIWVVLLFCMGSARAILQQINTPQAKHAGFLVLLLILYCLAYPFYTLAIDSCIGGAFGNVSTFIFSCYVLLILRRAVEKPFSKAFWLVFPVLPWIIYASLATLPI